MIQVYYLGKAIRSPSVIESYKLLISGFIKEYFSYTNGRCREKTSFVSNYVFSTLLHEWVNRGQTHRLEKLQ